MDINVNVHFEDNFVNALSDIAACLAAVSVANSGNVNARLPEKTVEPPKAPTKKAEPKKDTKTAEKTLTGAPVSPAKAKEINDLVKEPEPKKAEDEDTPTREEIEAIRGKAAEFMAADKETNQPKLAAWLKENGLIRVSFIETRAQIDSLKALIGGGKVA